MPLTVPCEFCGPTVSNAIYSFTKVEPRSTVGGFSYVLYRNLFRRFGFDVDLWGEYNVIRDNTPYTDQIEQSVWALSHAFRDYYKIRFRKLLPYFINSFERYCFFIKSFGKQLFREHVCAFKFLVFCGFISELSVFCHRRSMENTLNNAAWHLQVFFNDYLESDFYATVGWHKLQRTAEHVSIDYKRMQYKIDFDPKIEKNFYSVDQVLSSFDVFQLLDPWIVQTAKYLCLLNEYLDVFHLSSVNVSDTESEEQSLRPTANDPEIQHDSERDYNIQSAEYQNMLTENVQTYFENELAVQSTEMNLQLIEGPKRSKVSKRRYEERNIRKNFNVSEAVDIKHPYL